MPVFDGILDAEGIQGFSRWPQGTAVIGGGRHCYSSRRHSRAPRERPGSGWGGGEVCWRLVGTSRRVAELGGVPCEPLLRLTSAGTVLGPRSEKHGGTNPCPKHPGRVSCRRCASVSSAVCMSPPVYVTKLIWHGVAAHTSTNMMAQLSQLRQSTDFTAASQRLLPLPSA